MSPKSPVSVVINRRAAVVSGALLAGGCLAAASVRAATSGVSRKLDFTNPFDNLYAFGKVQGTYGKEAVYPTFKGVQFGRSGTEASRPLFGYEGFSTIRIDLTEEGHLRWWAKEIAFYTDLETGLPLKTWDNPYTGEKVEVMHFLNDHQLIVLTDKMPEIKFKGQEEQESSGSLRTGLTSAQLKAAKDAGKGTPFVLPWTVEGDLAMFILESPLSYPNPLDPKKWPKESTGPFINPAEHYSFFTSLAELSDTGVASAKFTGGFTRAAPWWPWMLMGKVPGEMVTRAHMWKRTDTLDNVPKLLRSYVEANYPQFLELPKTWDKSLNPSTWELYAATRQPAK